MGTMETYDCEYDRLVAHWNPTFSETVFLPPGVKWADVADPRLAHLDQLLLNVIPGVLVILILRYMLEGYILPHVGLALGVPKETKPRSPVNGEKSETYRQLEDAHKAMAGVKSLPRNKLAVALSKKTGLSVYQVECWLRRQKKLKAIPTIQKYSESAFKVIFYTTAFVYGMSGLWNSTWMWDLRECFRGLPFDHVTEHAKRYYILELAYYVSCTVTLPLDNKRKDFKEMVIHHLATIFLLCFSYQSNCWRVGTLVMALHDIGDIILEFAKTIHYARRMATANVLFVVFTVVFFLSRLVLLPIVIHSCLYHTVELYLKETLWDYVTKNHFVVSHCVLNALLILLFALHVFWMSIIFRMAVKFVGSGNLERDARSEQDSDDSSHVTSDKGVSMNHTHKIGQ